MDVATSASAEPAAPIRAVCSSVGAPPKAAPHSATAASSVTGLRASAPSPSMALATTARAPTSAGRGQRSASMPVIHIPATVPAPKTNRTRLVRPKPDRSANGAM